jgi:3',5'-cyclic AMP phosphodiesterase CpdA
MSKKPNEHSLEPGEVDRRGLLQCGAWAGAGILWTLSGGVPGASLLGGAAALTTVYTHTRALTFLQISDTHIGFNRPANPDPPGTLHQVITRIKALPQKPDFIIHTGDITHTSTPQQFDDAHQILQEIGLPIHYVPGEHDTQDEGNGREYLSRYGRGVHGDGWYSFDSHGVHFIALVNVVHLVPGGLGSLGADQIAWLRDDVAHLSPSTPIVVFAHMPLWSLYPQWGWGTSDADAALAPLARFGSVTVLNGHIHQIQQGVEGNITFHTARSTAYPQPAPGAAASPGPLLVPPNQLPQMIGLRSVHLNRGEHDLAVTDTALSA